jgi:alpha-glucoside transport system substrate-binding protein
MKKYLLKFLVILLLAPFVLPACSPPAEIATESADPEATEEMAEEPAVEVDFAIDCMGAEPGDEITMLYRWSGDEEESLYQILQPLIDACGIIISAESTLDQVMLDTRIKSGTPPDIAFWNLTQLLKYEDILVPMTELPVHSENYADFFKDPGIVDGVWLGLPVKADPKSLIWYSPANFDEAGYVVPESWDTLESLVEQMVVDGRVPWSMGFEAGGATGWTGADFIQDILLVTQGADYVRSIIEGSIPYNDPAVAEAWEIYGKWAMDEMYTIGGATGTISIGFNDAILLVFSDPPEAMMVRQSGFAADTISEQFPDWVYGEDYDWFAVPSAQGMQAGADWMMAFNDKPAIQALVAYLSSDRGGEKWAEVGFGLTPNSAGAEAYTDPALLKMSKILAAATDFTPDLGDSIPGGFTSAEFTGVSDYVRGSRDLVDILDELADIQDEALSE